jgi:hypothetical protein
VAQNNSNLSGFSDPNVAPQPSTERVPDFNVAAFSAAAFPQQAGIETSNSAHRKPYNSRPYQETSRHSFVRSELIGYHDVVQRRAIFNCS